VSERFDILVVGAGPAGIAAAVSAADAGQRVGLVDDNPAPGGQTWRSGASPPAAARSLLARLDAAPVQRLQGWRVFDSPARGVLRAECDNECADLEYGKLILATGARERFLPFPGWTLPNVMGAGGLDAMVRGGLPIAGKRVVVAGTGPLLLAVAAHLARRGATIVAICEQAPLRRLVSFAAHLLNDPAKMLQGIEYSAAAFGSKIYTSCWPASADGKDKLETVTLARKGKRWDERCDYLACGFHLTPNLELPALLGCRIEDGFVVVDDLLRASDPDVFCAGEPTGIGGVELALMEGQIAGLAAAGKSKEATKLAQRRQRRLGFVRALRRATALDPQLKTLASDETLVCRCEDVALGALREQPSWRDAKLHTRCGMGPCQGRICGAATEFLLGWSAVSTHSGVRPPIFPARVSSLKIPGKFTMPVESRAPSIALHPKENQ
jgi:NADPH-dependent 2,4-dienoyl-CoA reductase/sulfur reductase-like enzyme